MAKRVYCLYRVSTKGQVEKDDIPMQKQRCREFAAEKGWSITREFSEKGVSGFKVSAKDRDAIQEIQRDAAQDKFDVLLVFMFDRLGRKEDETPFVVEWFVQNGIEVWSAEEVGGESQDLGPDQDQAGPDRTGRALPWGKRPVRLQAGKAWPGGEEKPGAL